MPTTETIFARALATCLCLAALASAQTVIVAKTGDPAPDGNGSFYSFGEPALNDSGQAAFLATLGDTSGGSADSSGIFRGSGGALTQIVRKGQTAPDGNGSISLLYDPGLNELGQVAFLATLAYTSGGPIDDTAIFRGSGGALTQIARKGETAPDGNGIFSVLGSPALNDSGQAAFLATLGGTSGGTTDNSGIFRGSGGALTRIARKGQAAPDGNGILSVLAYPAVNDAGQAAFWASLAGTSGGPGDDTGIFRGSGGAITQIAREGQPAPDGNGSFSALAYPALNNSGQATFWASLAGASGTTSAGTGIFRGSGGSIAQIARAGQLAPDGNGSFYSFGVPALNDAGQAAFSASLVGTSGGSRDNTGIFRGSGGPLTQIVREGEPAPDGNGSFSGFVSHAVNASGQAAFHAYFAGTSGGDSDDAGLCIGDGVEIVQAVREGQAMAGSTITLLEFYDGAGDERNGWNESGQVAYKADLADGREVIAVWTPQLHWRSAASGDWSISGNWTLGIAPASRYDVLIDPSGSVNVTGPLASTTVKSLSVGATGGELATLLLNGGGDLAVAGGVTVTTGGSVEVGSGRVLSATTVSNSGILSGDGTIQAALSNQATGEIRVAGGQLVFGNAGHTNAGKIEVIDGEIEFIGVLTNAPSTGLIAGSEATMLFTGGLTNHGSLALSVGTSDVSGDIVNAATGNIVVSGNSQATFYDDVVNTGTIQVSTGSTAVFFGDFSGNGCSGGGTVFLEGDTRPGASPGTMNFGGDVVFGALSELCVELNGPAAGTEYDQVNVTASAALAGNLDVQLAPAYVPLTGRWFDVLTAGSRSGTFAGPEATGYAAGKSLVRAYDAAGLSILATWNGDATRDGAVDVSDLAILAGNYRKTTGQVWASGDFTGDGAVDVSDLAILAGNYRKTAEVGNAPVPEPATLALLALGGIALIRRRRK